MSILIERLTNKIIQDTLNCWWAGKHEVINFTGIKNLQQMENTAYISVIFLHNGEEFKDDFMICIEPNNTLSIWGNVSSARAK